MAMSVPSKRSRPSPSCMRRALRGPNRGPRCQKFDSRRSLSRGSPRTAFHTPPGGKYITIGGGWAFVANARGSNPKAAGEFCARALASPKDGSVERIVDWCTKAKSDMPPTKSALEAGKAAFQSGFLKIFTDEIYPAARAEPRMPPPAYKAISDAIQACQLNEEDQSRTIEFSMNHGPRRCSIPERTTRGRSRLRHSSV
jgi:hypothetical protein